MSDCAALKEDRYEWEGRKNEALIDSSRINKGGNILVVANKIPNK